MATTSLSILKFFISTYGPYITLAGAGIFLFTFLVIYLISVITNKPISLKLGPFSINSLKSKDNNHIDKTDKIREFINLISKNDVPQCPFLDSIVETTKDKMEQKWILHLKETVIRQMVVAEETNIKIKSIMANKYSDLLEKRLDENQSAKTHRDYRYYQVIVSNILEDVKRRVVKTSFENNYVVNFNESQWEDFIRVKTSTIVTIVFDYIDLMYMNNKLINLNEVHEINESIKLQIKEELTVMYRSIKSIIEEDAKRIRKIDSELREELDRAKNSTLCPVVQVKRILE